MISCRECGKEVPPRIYPGGTARIFCSRRCGRLGQHRRYHVKTAAKHRAEARKWEADNPIYSAFLKQRRSAKLRNIKWELTFEEWTKWWGVDIKFRGRYKNSLCMCRYNDAGPYSLGNIYKGSMSHNVAFARKKGTLANLQMELEDAGAPKARGAR